jgi:hypothetical protein
MASANQCDDSSEWEAAPATKRPRASQESEQVELQEDHNNYGTLSSQRPTRDRKPPERYNDLPFQPARKKAKASPKKAATKLKSTLSPRKFTSMPKRRRQQVVTTESQGSAGTPQIHGKKSAAVRLKVPLGRTAPITPPRHPFLDDRGSDLDSVLSSPPDSLLAQSAVGFSMRSCL